MIHLKERNLNKNNKTPLHKAYEKNSNQMIELLISKGANINIELIIYHNMI